MSENPPIPVTPPLRTTIHTITANPMAPIDASTNASIDARLSPRIRRRQPIAISG